LGAFFAAPPQKTGLYGAPLCSGPGAARRGCSAPLLSLALPKNDILSFLGLGFLLRKTPGIGYSRRPCRPKATASVPFFRLTEFALRANSKKWKQPASCRRIPAVFRLSEFALRANSKKWLQPASLPARLSPFGPFVMKVNTDALAAPTWKQQIPGGRTKASLRLNGAVKGIIMMQFKNEAQDPDSTDKCNTAAFGKNLSGGFIS
jgi:hypothetical protein